MTEAEQFVIRQSENKGDSPILLRKGVPGEKKPLKEKLIAYYEILFKVLMYLLSSYLINNYSGWRPFKKKRSLLGRVFSAEGEMLHYDTPYFARVYYMLGECWIYYQNNWRVESGWTAEAESIDIARKNILYDCNVISFTGDISIAI